MHDTLVLSPSGRTIGDCAEKVRVFKSYDEGFTYIRYQPKTPADELWPEDLAVTLAFNSRPSGRAFKSVVQLAGKVDLSVLPEKQLADTSSRERDSIADFIAEIAGWPGFAASLATKMLHKKRPALIPVLDNHASFEAYLDERWPTHKTTSQSRKDRGVIRSGLEHLAHDLNRPENQLTWAQLANVDASLTQLELLDMIWWVHFRITERVR